MASVTLQKSAFLAATAVSSVDQARASTTVVSLPAVSARRNASMLAVAAVSRPDLETKSLAQLRAIARQRGISASTKEQIISALTGGAQKPAVAAAAASADANEAFLAAKPLSELRALAAQRGLRGDTKAEIVKLLLSAGVASAVPAAASAPVSYSAEALAPVVPAVAIPTDDYARRLQVKPISKLRAVARMRGVVGTSRAELVKGLLAYHSKAIVAQPSPKAVAEAAEDKDELVEQLEELTLGELRGLARERGVRGDTRAELIKLLTVAPKAKAAAPAPTYTNGAATSSSSYSAPAAAAAVPSVRDLSTKSLAQLRAMAAQRGIRGATKQELVKALTLAL